MPSRSYTDTQGKAILLNPWRYRPTSWTGHWVRTRPSSGRETMPALVRSEVFGTLGARTEPNGMYVRLAANGVTADVLAIEICTSLQNVHDKRSRYAPSTTSLLLKLNRPWLGASQRVQNSMRQRWQTFDGSFRELPPSDQFIPVFRLRLFLLVPCEHVSSWSERVALEAHEYLLPHRTLDNQYGDRVKALLAHAFHDRVWNPIEAPTV